MGSDSDKLKELEEEERCPIGSREALRYGQQIVGNGTRRCNASCDYCTDSAPKAQTWTDGETSAMRNFSVQAWRETAVQGEERFIVVAK